MHGWTIITPPGWGMPFLSSLIFTGSRVGGLREVKSQAIESGLPYFPDDFSGTELGHQAQTLIGAESKAKWDRTPPAKRASFETLGTRSPFEPDWDVVCGIMQAQTPEEGFEQTQRMEEDSIRLWLLYGQNTREVVTEAFVAEDPAESLLRSVDAARLSHNLPSLNIEGPKLYQGALVLVKVTMCGRGTPTDMSAIYSISKEEEAAWSSKSKHPVNEAYEV
jgi:ribonuclease P/MRP protein subunit POP1